MNYRIDEQVEDIIGDLRHVEFMHDAVIDSAKAKESLQEKIRILHEGRDELRKIVQDVAIRAYKLMDTLIKESKKEDAEYYDKKVYVSGADIIALSNSVLTIINYVARNVDFSYNTIEKLNSLSMWLTRAQVAVEKINDALVDELSAAVKDFTKKFKSIDEHLAVLDYLVVQARIDKAISGNGNGEGTPTP